MSHAATSIPQAVLSKELQDRMQGKRLVTALFTTFSLDPGFFEQEVLHLFFEEQTSHLPRLRAVQVEQSLHRLQARPAVYYDPQALNIESTARLDFARHPVRLNACFHPKLVCLLLEADAPQTDADAAPMRELVVACLSANLTESGWWRSLECGHVEVLRAGGRCAFKEDLTAFLKWLAEQSPAAPPAQVGQRFTKRFAGEAAGLIVAFLEQGMGADFQRQGGEGLRTRFLWKRPGASLLEDFIEEFAHELHGMNLEVVSPFFSHDDSPAPLDEIIAHFEPAETRVFMPKNERDEPGVSRALHDAIGALKNTAWGALPKECLSAGSGAQAVNRGVHAKLYRFFSLRPKREVWVLGSANLTRAAWQKGGNMECLYVVERECASRPAFLLEVDAAKPAADAVTLTDPLEMPVEDAVLTAFSLRYDWASGVAQAHWDGEAPPEGLRLSVAGVELGAVSVLKSQTWCALPSALAERIATHLRSTALFTVSDAQQRSSIILVMEDAAQTHKPSQLEQLSAADIMKYWSLLTAEQRNRWLETRLHDLMLAASADGEHLPTSEKLPKDAGSLFERMAGFFHAFHHLEQSVGQALKQERPSLAVARLFGRAHDSLHRLLDRLEQPEACQMDAVDRYIITLSMRQALGWVRAHYEDFWRQHREEAGGVEGRVRSLADSLRQEITHQGETVDFLDWFEAGFLKRAGEGRE